MAKDIVQLNAAELVGPRSFFTDLDPKDQNYDPQTVSLKLKLQLLTKEKIVIAASSLFTDVGCDLLSNEKGYVDALEQGIIVPAIRNDFADPKDYFKRYTFKNCSISSRNFFTNHVNYSVPWDLKQNSSWFEKTFCEHLLDEHSLLRQKTSLTESMAKEFIKQLYDEKQKTQAEHEYLRREHICDVSQNFGDEVHSYMSNYANLVYRISGSRVVNCEGHFPQSNLTNLGVASNDRIISDDKIFWDIYVETMISFLNSATQLTPERLEKLSVYDILKIRQALFDMYFSREYDNLIKNAKSKIDIHDPSKLILKQSEINAAAQSLRARFAERLLDEVQIKKTASTENSLWQVGNAIALLSSQGIGFAVGLLSTCASIPEITTLVSKQTSEKIKNRYEWVRYFINCRIGWSKEQKTTLMDGYRKLLTYGLPE